MRALNVIAFVLLAVAAAPSSALAEETIVPTRTMIFNLGLEHTYNSGDERVLRASTPVAATYTQSAVDLVAGIEYLESFERAGSRIGGFWSPPIGYLGYMKVGYMYGQSHETLPTDVVRPDPGFETNLRFALGAGTSFQLVHSASFLLAARIVFEYRLVDQAWYGPSPLLGLAGLNATTRLAGVNVRGGYDIVPVWLGANRIEHRVNAAAMLTSELRGYVIYTLGQERADEGGYAERKLLLGLEVLL